MPTDLLLLTVTPIITAVSGLAGVGLGAWLAQHNQKIERRQRRIREQLEEFYAPMLGYRERLRARGKLRLKVHNAAGAEWARLVEQAREMGMEAMKELRENRWLSASD